MFRFLSAGLRVRFIAIWILSSAISQSAISQHLRLVPQPSPSGTTYCTALSPDADLVAVGDWEGKIQIWDVSTGLALRTLKGSDQGTRSLNFSPSGESLVAGDYEGTIRIWNVVSGQLQTTLSDYPSPIQSVSFSRSGRSISALHWDGTIRTWNMTAGLTQKRPDHIVRFAAGGLPVDLSSDGRTMAKGGYPDGQIRLWDVYKGKLAKVISPNAHRIVDVAFSPDGRTLVSAGAGGAIQFWDVATGKPSRIIHGFETNAVSNLNYTPDGRSLLCWGKDNDIRIVSLTGQRIKRINASRYGVPTAIACSQSGQQLVVSYMDRGFSSSLQIWSLTTGQVARTFHPGSCGVLRTVFSSDSRTMVTASLDNKLRLWDTELGRQTLVISGQTDSLTNIAFSPDGRMVASASRDKTTRFWEIPSGRIVGTIPGHTNSSLAFSPDGHLIACGNSDNTVRIWNTSTFQFEHSISNRSGPVAYLSFSPDGQKLAVGTTAIEYSNGAGTIFDVATGRSLGLFSVKGTTSTSAVFLPNGKALVSAYYDGKVLIWDLETHQVTRSLDAGNGAYSLEVSPDGKTIAVADYDRKVHLWDIATGRVLHVLAGLPSQVSSVAFSADGTRLACSTLDGTVRLWDIRSGKELASLISFADGSWAVTDAVGRFDGSDGGNVSGLHWVYDDISRRRMEPIDLGQFANFYFSPGLLTKIWNGQELTQVLDLQNVQLYPRLSAVKVVGNHVRADLFERGGGLGDVHVRVNGIEMKTVSGADHLDIDLGDKLKGLVNPDIQLFAFNAQNTVHSRSVTATIPSRAVETTPTSPKIVAVVGSVQNYANPSMSLSYADADAVSVTQALLAMASGLGAEAHIELVCGDPMAKSLASPRVNLYSPNKAGFNAAFASAAARADSGSVFFVYLSGHGTALQKDAGKSDEYYFLTRDARDGLQSSLREPEVARQWAISGAEIRGYLARALSCKRRFVVLDTCSAGATKGQLMALRGESEDEIRARREFQQGTGTFALMGAASGKSSLEAAEYGHGLLTYALLSTLKNRRLGDEQSLDTVIASKLVAETQAVTRELAQDIGRGQEPMAIAPDAGIVVLGRMNDIARASIFLTSRLPLLLKPSLTDVDSGDTTLGSQLADLLREMSVSRKGADGSKTFASYLPEDIGPDGYRLQGTYSDSNGILTVKASVYRNGKRASAPFPPIAAPKATILPRLIDGLRQWLSANRANGSAMNWNHRQTSEFGGETRDTPYPDWSTMHR